MKTMISKYPGTCRDCQKPIKIGTPIKYYGRGCGAGHVNCYNPDGKSDAELAAEVRAPCWICGDAGGKFRPMGAAAPVWCDACHAKQNTSAPGYGLRHFRPAATSASAEDGCCSDSAYEDRCREACGL